jgi:hypothetical protein
MVQEAASPHSLIDGSEGCPCLWFFRQWATEQQRWSVTQTRGWATRGRVPGTHQPLDQLPLMSCSTCQLISHTLTTPAAISDTNLSCERWHCNSLLLSASAQWCVHGNRRELSCGLGTDGQKREPVLKSRMLWWFPRFTLSMNHLWFMSSYADWICAEWGTWECKFNPKKVILYSYYLRDQLQCKPNGSGSYSLNYSEMFAVKVFIVILRLSDSALIWLCTYNQGNVGISTFSDPHPRIMLCRLVCVRVPVTPVKADSTTAFPSRKPSFI